MRRGEVKYNALTRDPLLLPTRAALLPVEGGRWDKERQPLKEYKAEDMEGFAIGSDFLTYAQKTLDGLDRKSRERIQKDVELSIKAQEAEIEKKPKD